MGKIYVKNKTLDIMRGYTTTFHKTEKQYWQLKYELVLIFENSLFAIDRLSKNFCLSIASSVDSILWNPSVSLRSF